MCEDTCVIIQSICHHGMVQASVRQDMGEAAFTYGYSETADPPKYHLVNNIATRITPPISIDCNIEA